MTFTHTLGDAVSFWHCGMSVFTVTYPVHHDSHRLLLKNYDQHLKPWLQNHLVKCHYQSSEHCRTWLWNHVWDLYLDYYRFQGQTTDYLSKGDDKTDKPVADEGFSSHRFFQRNTTTIDVEKHFCESKLTPNIGVVTRSDGPCVKIVVPRLMREQIEHESEMWWWKCKP